MEPPPQVEVRQYISPRLRSGGPETKRVDRPGISDLMQDYINVLKDHDNISTSHRSNAGTYGYVVLALLLWIPAKH